MRAFVASILAFLGLLCVPAARAGGAVNPPLVLEPAHPRGTVILIHLGGWSGPNLAHQRDLLDTMGPAFADRGFRAVSIDYAAGEAGLDSVVAQIREQRRRSGGPVCLYGESAGGELALVAAARDPSVACVMAFGTPTDFAAWPQEALAEDNPISYGVYASTALPVFGEPGPATAPWEPVHIARRIRGDVFMARAQDDPVVPAGQLGLFTAVLPTTQTYVAPAGDPGDPAQRYLHGTVSPAGLATLRERVGAFAARARTHWARDRGLERLGCAGASTSVLRLSPARLRRTLACLARRSGSRLRRRAGWRRRVRVTGAVTPARIFQAAAPGRAATSGALRVELDLGATSLVTLAL